MGHLTASGKGQDIMRFIPRAACMIGAAVTALAPIATATASAASTSSARGTAHAAKGCLAVTATVPVGLFPRGTIYVTNEDSDTVSVLAPCRRPHGGGRLGTGAGS